MSSFFYFTDTDLVSSQSSNGAFGPVEASDPVYESTKEKYRLTSIHTASANPLAYAICKGQVLVQQDETNPSLVNIVLKPLDQPSTGLPVIKYFIYRGILKSSLTNGTNIIDGGNTFTSAILANNAETPQKVLGIELTGFNFQGTDPVDHAFYLPKEDFELWTVFGGWSLGTFDKDGFGLEVITERVGYNLTFSTARMETNLIELTKLTGTPSQADVFDYKTSKEAVVNYIDPCAFYGSFFSSSLMARSSTDATEPDNIHTFLKKKEEEIYRELIDGGSDTAPATIFFNKNIIYIDIRNEQNFSLNYFENYADDLKISFADDGEEPIAIVNYYGTGWPVLMLDDLPGGDNTTFLRIAFPTSSETMIPLVCVLTGERKISFVERVKRGKSAFMNLENPGLEYTSTSLSLVSPNYNETVSVSQYIKLKYIDQASLDDLNTINNLMPVKEDTLDFIFQPTAFNEPIPGSDAVRISVYEEDAYVNLLDDFGIDYTSKIGMVKDNLNTALFWAISKRNTKSRLAAQSPSLSITNSVDKSQTYFSTYAQKKVIPDQLTSKTITVDGDPVQLIKEISEKRLFFNNRNNIDFNTEFFSIILANADFATIESVATTNFDLKYPPFLCVTNRTKAADLNHQPYISYELALKGLKRSSTDTMEMMSFPTGILIYSYPIEDLKNN